MAEIVKADFTVVEGPAVDDWSPLNELQWLLLHIAEKATEAEGDTLEDLTHAFTDAAILLDKCKRLYAETSALAVDVRSAFRL
jgi:hypothetical protein